MHKQYECLVQCQSDCTFTVLKRLYIHGHLKNVLIPRFFLFWTCFHGAISIPRNVRTGCIYLWVESDNIRCINIQNVGQTCESGRNCYIKTATYRNFKHQKLVSYCIFATLVLILKKSCLIVERRVRGARCQVHKNPCYINVCPISYIYMSSAYMP